MERANLNDLSIEELETIDGGRTKYGTYLLKSAGGGAVGGAIVGGVAGAVIGANVGAVWGTAAYLADSAISGRWR